MIEALIGFICESILIALKEFFMNLAVSVGVGFVGLILSAIYLSGLGGPLVGWFALGVLVVTGLSLFYTLKG